MTRLGRALIRFFTVWFGWNASRLRLILGYVFSGRLKEEKKKSNNHSKWKFQRPVVDTALPLQMVRSDSSGPS